MVYYEKPYVNKGDGAHGTAHEDAAAKGHSVLTHEALQFLQVYSH